MTNTTDKNLMSRLHKEILQIKKKEKQSKLEQTLLYRKYTNELGNSSLPIVRKMQIKTTVQ